jgi:hypothetical protein
LTVRKATRKSVRSAALCRHRSPALAIAQHDPSDADFAYHVETYRSFVKLSFLFAAHALVILALLAYFFA